MRHRDLLTFGENSAFGPEVPPGLKRFVATEGSDVFGFRAMPFVFNNGDHLPYSDGICSLDADTFGMGVQDNDPVRSLHQYEACWRLAEAARSLVAGLI